MRGCFSGVWDEKVRCENEKIMGPLKPDLVLHIKRQIRTNRFHSVKPQVVFKIVSFFLSQSQCCFFGINYSFILTKLSKSEQACIYIHENNDVIGLNREYFVSLLHQITFRLQIYLQIPALGSLLTFWIIFQLFRIAVVAVRDARI